MKKFVLFVSVALLVTLSAGAAFAATPEVGDLLMEIAHLRGIQVDDPASARRGLQDSGVELPALDLRAPLTEGAVVEITRSLGIYAMTSRPDHALDDGDLTRFLVSFAGDIGDAPGGNQVHSDESAESDNGKRGPYPRPNENAADPLTKGKGKKKGIPRSPSYPN